MKIIACCLFLFVGVCGAEPSTYDLILAHPDFTGQSCAQRSPEAYYAGLETISPEIAKLTGRSPAAIDRFYEAYETRLRAYTDQKFPAASELRAQLCRAFDEIHTAIVTAYDGSGAHDFERLHARVEWLIFSGLATDYRTRNATVEIAALRQAVWLFAESHGLSEARRKAVFEHIEAGLQALESIGPATSKDGMLFYRSQLFKFIGSYYGDY